MANAAARSLAERQDKTLRQLDIGDGRRAGKGFRLPRKFFPHAIVMIDHGACP
jgi:hypothetical protein